DEVEVKNLVAEANGNITFVAQWREDNKYTVIFQDDAGNLLQESSVYEGEDAIAPVVPNKDGYTFVGWDKDFTNVRGDLVVTAIYEENVVVIIPPTIPGQPTLPTDTLPTPIIPPVVTAPGVANTPVTPVQPDAPVQGEQTVTPPVDNEEIIEDQEVPLATIGGSWALVNLICTIVVTILGIFLLLAKHKKDEDEEDNTVAYKRRRWTKVATIVVAIVTIVAFIITEDMTLPMILTDKWTIAMLILTLVQIVVVCVGRKWKEDKEQQETITA
ncbi:MAG: InlB B-repeat-containing protein, partial [Coprobacillus sp.]